MDWREWIITRVWRATGDPLHHIMRRWTVGDLFLALQALEVDRAIQKESKPHGHP